MAYQNIFSNITPINTPLTFKDHILSPT